jgi:hypothetical protein
MMLVHAQVTVIVFKWIANIKSELKSLFYLRKAVNIFENK